MFQEIFSVVVSKLRTKFSSNFQQLQKHEITQGLINLEVGFYHSTFDKTKGFVAVLEKSLRRFEEI
jgi:hypothetical protein